MLSHLLYSLFTHDWVESTTPTPLSVLTTQGVCLIIDKDETAYRGERPGSVVPGQHPLPQREQDKGDDRGLQEKEGRTRPFHIDGAVV